MFVSFFFYNTFMSWASRRRTTYLLFIFGGLFVALAIAAFILFRPVPSCENGAQDGNETGIDCGGSCRAICAEDAIPPIVRWSRLFKVTSGVYSAVAYVENTNQNAGAKSVAYSFRFFDEKGILVAERKGATFLSPGGLSPIFESNIKTGQRAPARTVFSFTEQPRWERAAPSVGQLTVKDKMFSADGSSPRITATLQNTTIGAFSNIQVVAVAFNADQNAIAASATLVPRIEKNGATDIVFTWPEPFPSKAVQIDIIPRIPLRD